MAPPTTKLRLSEIDPDAFAQELVAKVVRDLNSRSIALAPVILHLDAGRVDGKPWPLEKAIPSTTLYHEARDLALWARDGKGEADYTHDLCLSIATACWPSPLYEGDRGPDLFDDATLETEPGLLIVAAFAREKIARGEPISARELSVLAGVAQAHVNLLAREGEIRRGRDDLFAAKEARRWLGARGAAGFAP